jgi:hypothetical protein
MWVMNDTDAVTREVSLDLILSEIRLLRKDIERLDIAKSKMLDVETKLLPVSVVAKMLGRSKARVYELCLSGELRSIKDGASILIPTDEPGRWLIRKLKQRS